MQPSHDYTVTYNIELYIVLYSKTLNPTLHVSRCSSAGKALGL